MTITYINGIYRMVSENRECSVLIKELQQAINMLEQDMKDYKAAYYNALQYEDEDQTSSLPNDKVIARMQ